MSDLTEKVCYLIKCEVEEAYYDDQHQVHFKYPTAYFTGNQHSMYGKKYDWLSIYPTNAKKFFALEIANSIKEKIKNSRFIFKNAMNVKIRNLEVTTPEKEGLVEIPKGEVGIIGGSL